MCEQCQQLQARVAQLEGVLRLVSERAGWSGRRYEVYEVDMNKLRAALTAPPSPVRDVVRASVAYHDRWATPSTVEQHQERHQVLMAAVAALLEQQPGVWE